MQTTAEEHETHNLVALVALAAKLSKQYLSHRYLRRRLTHHTQPHMQRADAGDRLTPYTVHHKQLLSAD